MAYEAVNITKGSWNSKEEQICDESKAEFSQLQTYRAVFAEQWEEIAQVVDHAQSQYVLLRQLQFPRAEEVRSPGRCQRHAGARPLQFNPRQPAHAAQHDVAYARLVKPNYVMKNRDARLYFEAVTRILFRHRYAPIANFAANNQSIFHYLGAYGTGNMFVDQARVNESRRTASSPALQVRSPLARCS